MAGLAEGDLAPDWVTQFQHLAGRRGRRRSCRNPTRWWWPPRRPDGAVASRCVLCKGARRAGCRLLHQPELGQEPRPAGQPAGGGHVPVDRAATAGALPRPGGPGRRTRPPTSTGRPARGARGSGPGPARSRPCCRIGPRWRHCRTRPQQRFGDADDADPDPVAAVLGRLADPAGDGGVLAGQVRAAARPASLPGQRVRRLDRRTTGALSGHVTTEIPPGPAGPTGRGGTRPVAGAATRPQPPTPMTTRRGASPRQPVPAAPDRSGHPAAERARLPPAVPRSGHHGDRRDADHRRRAAADLRHHRQFGLGGHRVAGGAGPAGGVRPARRRDRGHLRPPQAADDHLGRHRADQHRAVDRAR